MPKIAKVANFNKVRLTFVAILVLAVFAFLIIWPNLPDYFPGQKFFNKFNPKLGLDLQGGAQLVYQSDLSQINFNEQSSALEGVRDVIERRINAFGVSEPVVQTSGNDRLIVEIAGVFDVQQAIKLIGETPLLEFKEQKEVQPIPLTEEEKAEAQKYNQEALNKAKNLIKKLVEQNVDFASLAKENSEDTGTKDNGGDLGFVKKGDLVAEFEKAIFDDLQVGEITKEPIKTEYGYHIIKKIEEKGEGDNREVHAAHILILTKDEEFKQPEDQDQWSNTSLSGKNLTTATVEFDPTTGQPNVALKFNDEGKNLFAEITKNNVGKPVAIFLDGEPISIPTVQEEITQGEAVITGNFNLKEAKLLAQRLNAGALPVPINLINQQTVGPALGKISLAKSLIAGFFGLIIVTLFIIIFYRLPGLLAVFALLIYGALSLMIFEMWPITLTLAGVTGFILSIGMAVDANVLIFERLKEEVRNGKPIALAIEEGFNRAWLSIRDSNVSSLITCSILTWFSSSSIKGFAITLGIGILVSMFTAITVTRTFLRLFGHQFLEKHPFLLGIKKSEPEKTQS